MSFSMNFTWCRAASMQPFTNNTELSEALGLTGTPWVTRTYVCKIHHWLYHKLLWAFGRGSCTADFTCSLHEYGLSWCIIYLESRTVEAGIWTANPSPTNRTGTTTTSTATNGATSTSTATITTTASSPTATTSLFIQCNAEHQNAILPSALVPAG